MSLITEHNIETADLDASTVHAAAHDETTSAPTPGVVDNGVAQTVAQLGRDTAEMHVQLHNLRTELSRSSAAVANSTRNTGIVLILAIVAATYMIATSRSADHTSAPAAGADPALEHMLGQLVNTIDQLGARIEVLNTSVAEQKQASALALKAVEQAGGAMRSGDKLDCAKLPKDIKGSEADFSVQFQSGSAKILPGSEATLDGIAKILALVPTHCVIIEGHADATGNSEKNLALSKERAMSVLDYVATRSNLNRNQLVAIGRGSSSPPAGTDALDPANRRVIFKVVPPGS